MKRTVRCLWIFIVFLLQSAIAEAIDARKNQWEKTEFIWNFGIIASCDKGLNQQPIEFFEAPVQFYEQVYEHIEAGNIVWIRSRLVKDFYHKVLPNILHSCVLVISDGDESFPSNSRLAESELEELVSHKKIIHIFAQNCDYKGPSDKVSHLPIGVDFHTVAYKSEVSRYGEWGSPVRQEKVLKSLLRYLAPTYLRKRRAFVDFQLSDNIRLGCFSRYLERGEDRASIFNQLLATNLIDYSDRMRRSKLWATKGKYAFSISPHGNGLDCHRTWEDLILGCIVIVKSSPLDPMYEGLPVVIVKDWSEITEENLDKWIDLYGDAFTNPSYREKLTNKYWFSKIQAAANPYKVCN